VPTNTGENYMRELLQQALDALEASVPPPGYLSDHDTAIDALRAALAAQEPGVPYAVFRQGFAAVAAWKAAHAAPAPAVPPGWVLVPVEPTQEMVKAGWAIYSGTDKNEFHPNMVWVDMIAAAPPAPPASLTPLTDRQIAKALADAGLKPEDYREDGMIEPLVRAIEAAHGITAHTKGTP